MTARVLTAGRAVGRLGGLGLSIDLVERVVRRADAEAAFCTAFDPPIMEGLTRWARTNRLASPDSAGDRGIVVEVSRL